MHSWQTLGAVSSVAPVSPAIRVVTSPGPTPSTTTSTAAGSTSAMLRRYSRTRSWTRLPDRRDRRSPLRDEMQLDAHGAVLSRHAHRVLPRQRTVREPSHSVDLPRRIRGVAGEDLGRDRRLTGHAARLAPSQHQLRRLGPRGEAERDERRAEPGRDVHRRGCAPVDAGVEPSGRDARSGPCRPGTGARSGRRACGRRGRGRSGPAREGRARAGSGRAGSRGRPRRASAFGSSRGRPAHDQPRVGSGDPDAPAAQLEHARPRRGAAWPARAPAGRSGAPAGRGSARCRDCRARRTSAAAALARAAAASARRADASAGRR